MVKIEKHSHARSTKYSYSITSLLGSVYISEEELLELCYRLHSHAAQIRQRRATENAKPFHEAAPDGKCEKACPACAEKEGIK